MKYPIMTGLAIFSMHAYAQPEAGTLMAGGSISYVTRSVENSNLPAGRTGDSYFSGGLRAGVFITKHIAIGIEGGHSSSRNNYTNAPIRSEIVRVNSFGIFSRYYNMLGESRFAFFTQLSASYATGESTNIRSTGTSSKASDLSEMQAKLIPGIVFFINKKFALEAAFAQIAYSRQTTRIFNSSVNALKSNAQSTLTADLSLASVSLGIHYYLVPNKTRPSSEK